MANFLKTKKKKYSPLVISISTFRFAEFTMSGIRQLENVGQLSFRRSDCLGSGRFGKVFTGKFINDMEVAIKRMEKEKTQVDLILLLKARKHPNIIDYYTTEESDVEFT